MSNYEVRFTKTASKDVNKLTPKLKIKLREIYVDEDNKIVFIERRLKH